ncbi:methylated-DNA--[protein]-cysteine S-methyltransferase [Thermoactinomyces intermedius]|jgi:methylated-DNA-[protein]-cysteine S-methyltransferase|uniref:Methylated-DNA--protein-cysteine methyltransferase n=1 Tax=Thermoactinomyces intermedius TaxID=2024 RepID=A0A8I1ADS2_THEIN|nr:MULTISPECIES: methylated-DNA--[protein]-cysteine S-methyltransferase [Thermoactinomyces]MBA4549692.1 methylated-DNA--[protein]-cysteine S-methyltransferase [Thermoactinomyces intermedius]MBA4835066.1 methylated-DNA--[protein]-cysteine S-methyltransferase [Thermoactinomyces intermedius]MBH8595927.1 methylated-DNA--[protein]-cysteine S-methyltransferase [Thermoactinomyces intermedius]MBH8600905.1 methylated-DNA--[protein]-cysteine S-methyltransferase [Thermoactinomyces sp. CICC 23799]
MASGTQHLVWSHMESPVGLITLLANQRGLIYLDFCKQNDPVLGAEIWLNHWFRHYTLEKNEQALLPYMDEIDEYFQGTRKTFEIPFDLYGTPFQKRVWRQLSTIPYGEVRTYKEIASAIGSPKAVRAVGGANNKNPLSIVIPCHRVIGSNGSLVGYGGGLHIKEYLLTLEGWLKP